MHTFIHALVIAAVSAGLCAEPPAAAPAPAAPTGPTGAAEVDAPDRLVRAARADLARSYMRFERAVAARAATREGLAAASAVFDRVTAMFFALRFNSAIETLDREAARLEGDETPARRLAESLKVFISDRAVRPGEPVALRARPLYRVEGADLSTVALSVEMAGEAAVVVPAAGGEYRPAKPGVAEVFLEVRGIGTKPAFRAAAGRVWVGAPSIDDVREDILARLKEAEDGLESRMLMTPMLEASLAVARGRAGLLVARPSEADSAQWMADLGTLAKDLDREAASLEEGDDPYRRRTGDWWASAAEGETRIPFRVYAPAKAVERADANDERLPLFIALHGAGGDENMWPDAYGAGLLKRLADEHGFLIASPSTYSVMGSPKCLDRVVDAMAAWYPVDDKRICVIGHSMGGAAATGLARTRAAMLAGAVGIAGGRIGRVPAGGGAADRRLAPTLIYGAGQDSIVPSAGLRAQAERARAAGLAVEYREIQDMGHTLVVNAVLKEAVLWLLEKRRD
ncbi:MAG: dienelactone hydrolase family protein [Phycisphaerales bacterium]|nr:dienelactone hydrolase family protein [Phycisphaerales bacterium]